MSTLKETSINNNSTPNLANSTFKNDLIQKIQFFLMQKSEIRLVYLYGSFNSNNWSKKSDIDIGIVIDESSNKDPWYPIKLQNELSTRFQDRFKFDIRILNQASTKFKYTVLHNNPRIINRDEQFRNIFETQVLLEWYDIRETWNNFYKEQAEVLKSYD
ncbi:MAG: type VII toxin-antitoxin system MntA family adenylyltransferase antitoxin [Promethearchaeota archaeon]